MGRSLVRNISNLLASFAETKEYSQSKIKYTDTLHATSSNIKLFAGLIFFSPQIGIHAFTFAAGVGLKILINIIISVKTILNPLGQSERIRIQILIFNRGIGV